MSSIPPDLCGTGTRADTTTQKCVPDNEQILTQLIDQQYIQEIDNDIVFVPGYTPNVTIPIPSWFIQWTDSGAYSCQKEITRGICTIPGNNCHAPCRCADCAGWRGGNVTDCKGKPVGHGRVWCNLEPGEPFSFKGEPDRCQCASGFCAVNGLCVSPYTHLSSSEFKDLSEPNLCCPECSWMPPSEEGGCAGYTKCNPDLKCHESRVEYPGNKIFGPNFASSNVSLVLNRCTSPSDNAEENLCWHPDHEDARFRAAYVIINPTSSESFDTLCPELDNSASGQNEYECALKCGNVIPGDEAYSNEYNTVSSQIECSRRCLPKLWRWLPVYEKLANGNLRFADGYYQSEELLRYLPPDVKLSYCPEGKCEVSLSEPPDFSQINNCSECTGCRWIFSPYANNNGFQDRKYECDKCKKCILDQVNENGNAYQVECTDMIHCNTCTDIGTNLTLITGLSQNECDVCLDNDPNVYNSGCKVTTKDPYKYDGTKYVFQSGADVYNHGGNPGNVSGPAYDPGTRDAGCDFGLVEGLKTCDNTFDGKVGFGDGCFSDVRDCTVSCNISWQSC